MRERRVRAEEERVQPGKQPRFWPAAEGEVSILAAWKNFVSNDPHHEGGAVAAADGGGGGGGEAWSGPTALGDAIGMVLPRCCDPDAKVSRSCSSTCRSPNPAPPRLLRLPSTHPNPKDSTKA